MKKDAKLRIRKVIHSGNNLNKRMCFRKQTKWSDEVKILKLQVWIYFYLINN